MKFKVDVPPRVKKNKKVKSKKTRVIYVPVSPLSLNKSYTGRRFKTADLADYKAAVLGSLLHSYEEGSYEKPQYSEGDCEIHYVFHVKDLYRVDVDNLIKPLQDCLVEAKIIKDDRYVLRLTAEKRKVENKMDECTEVEIIPYD